MGFTSRAWEMLEAEATKYANAADRIAPDTPGNREKIEQLRSLAENARSRAQEARDRENRG